MVDYREILRLKSLNHSIRGIASTVHSSRDKVSGVLSKAEEKGICWPLDPSVSNYDLAEMLYPNSDNPNDKRWKEPDYPYIHRELAKSGVTLTLLWDEYQQQCHADGTTPYMYTQFCEKYRRWARVTKATMRIQHKPGEAMQVDWAGNTIPIFDPVTGEESAAYLFIAVLACSCYAYVEACPDMKTECWVQCHVHAYAYFGGVTKLLIPDNLKTGVTANTRYETVLNRSYEEMAQYYGTAIVPTRVRHPKDKSLAEGTVKFASTWITAKLRNEKFFSVAEVQRAVKEQLENLNNRSFQKRPGSRRSAYLEEEKEFMLPLPTAPYEAAVWLSATVGTDYLVSDGRNKYSVPYDLIDEKVDIRCTKDTVEIYFKGSRMAAHKRASKILRNPVVCPEHMPATHRAYLNYNADSFRAWATTVGPATEQVVSSFLNAGKAPEQGYKSCARLAKLGERYGKKPLESTCKHILSVTSTPSIRTIATVLKNYSDRKNTSAHESENSENYGITRGAAYFRKGGEQK